MGAGDLGRYLNPGNAMFQRSLDSEIYVDKSGLIACTNRVLGGRECCVCVSRPRRFGKSMTADMLVAYYGRGCDSRAQFEGLSIARHPTFESHLNAYDVIHLNMQDFLATSGGDVDAMIANLEVALAEDVASAYPDVPGRGAARSVCDLLADVFARTGRLVVFVIDEWDCVLRTLKDAPLAQARYLDWLRLLLKDKPYVGLAYMTGILPIKKYGQHSALNMFTEVSMLDARDYAPYTGFTEDEVAALCERYAMPLDQTRFWYDGYNVDDIQTFNPRSVVMAMTGRRYRGYWTQTETFEALRVYIDMNLDGLRDKVVRLVAGERVRVNTAKFQNDMTTFGSADDVLTLLVHLGYLTYQVPEFGLGEGEVWIPNSEVAGEFVSCIEDKGWEGVAAAIHESSALLESLLAKDERAVAQAVQRAHEENVSVLAYNDENSLSCVLSLALYAARRFYVLHREFPSGKGFADLVLAPRAGVEKPAVVVELKHGSAPEDALAQIRERNYASKLHEAGHQVLLCGIAYDPKTKEHACRIERG